MNLAELTGKPSDESAELACCGRLDRDDWISWLRTVAGSANAYGGELYIGVEGRTGELIGFDRKEADNERHYLTSMISSHLTPKPQISIDFLPYTDSGRERHIIRISVEQSDIPPVILLHDGIPSIFMRRDGYTSGATSDEIIEMCNETRSTRYDIQVSDEKFRFDRLTKLCRFHREHTGGQELREKELEVMGFVSEDGCLLKGAVLFQDDYQGGRTEVMCSLYAGFSRAEGQILATGSSSGCITDTISFMLAFVRRHMNRGLIKEKDRHRDFFAYPELALSAGIISAVALRDYSLDGTQIQVDMFRDRLEISSPGGFCRGEKRGRNYDLTGLIPRRHNELISRVLAACIVMKTAGSGFEGITAGYADQDRGHRPFICSSSDHFTLVLPDLTYLPGIADSTAPPISFMAAPGGTKHDRKILSFCYPQPRSVPEIAAYLGLKDSSFLRTRILGNLEKKGFLQKERFDRAVCYRTNRDMVELA